MPAPPEADAMTADRSEDDATGPVRTWLVERAYDNGGMVTLVYATPDGRRRLRRQFSAAYLESRSVTAARDADPEDLEPAPESERERYRQEVARVRDRHAPDDEL